MIPVEISIATHKMKYLDEKMDGVKRCLELDLAYKKHLTSIPPIIVVLTLDLFGVKEGLLYKREQRTKGPIY